MEAQVLLCDFANVTEGKLNIIGGGWSVVITQGPVKLAVAVRVNTRWDETNVPHRLSLTLVDQDGHVILGPRGNPMIRAGGEFEVGRPPGMTRGEDLPNPLAFDLPPLPLESGIYAFQVAIDTEPVGRATFRVVQQGIIQQQQVGGTP
jgi:hypothetical protein